MSTGSKERAVGLRNLISYGLGDLYGGGAWMIIGMLYMFFLTEIVGLKPGLAGLVFAIGKVWDSISDPLMGYISDRTRAKAGRRRIYFLTGFIPVGISFALLWINPGFSSQTSMFIFYSAAYIFFCTVYTFISIPHIALNAEMTTDYSTRTRLTSARTVFGAIASLAAGILPKIIVDAVGGDQGTAYMVMGCIFAVFFSVPWIIVYLGTWELPYEEVNREGESLVDVFREFGTIFKNSSFRAHMAIYISAYTALDITMAVFMYFLVYYLGQPELFPLAMGTQIVVQMAMFPVYAFIANKKGKGFAFRLGLIIWSVGMLSQFALEPGGPALYLALVAALIGFGNSAGCMIPFAILPEVIDVDELMTGKTRAGVYSGAMTLLRKMIQGVIAMPLIGYGLEMIGFVSNQQQSAETLSSLRLFYIWGPTSMVVIGVLVSLWFKVTPQNHQIVREEIARLKDGGKMDDVTPQVREVCESLTGQEYSSLYKS